MRLFGLLSLFVWFTASVISAAAQDAGGGAADENGRAAQAASARSEKLKTVKTASRSRLIEFLATAENEGIDQFIQFQLSDFRIGFGQISPVSGITPAVRYEKPRIASTELTLWLAGSYSLRDYQAYELLFGYFEYPYVPDYKGHAYPEAPFSIDHTAQDPMRPFLYFDSEYRTFPKERFYGTGPDSSDSNRTAYELEEFAAGIVGGYQFTRDIVVQGKALFLNPTVHSSPDNRFPDTGDLFDDDDAPGISGQPSFLRYGGSFLAGHYGDPFKPAALASVAFSRFDDRDTGLYSFNRFQADARAYLPLGCRQRLLAGRFFVSHDDVGKDHAVPFYFMESLGGSETLRGFKPQRFADRNILYMSAEYRWEGSPAVELAVFYDTGKAFSDPDQFNFENLKKSYGVGVRFKNKRKTILRLDIGHSREGTFGHLSTVAAF